MTTLWQDQERTKRLAKFDRDCLNGKVKAMIKDGARCSDIENQYHVSHDTVNRYCIKYGIRLPENFNEARKERNEDFYWTPARKLALTTRW